jgi:hypothetical protein
MISKEEIEDMDRGAKWGILLIVGIVLFVVWYVFTPYSPLAEKRTPTPQPTQISPTLAPQTTGSCPRGCDTPPQGCVIKGNISVSSGEKIYHLPGQRFYNNTIIDPRYGEKWFCTEAEAQANGWRKSSQ